MSSHTLVHVLYKEQTLGRNPFGDLGSEVILEAVTYYAKIATSGDLGMASACYFPIETQALALRPTKKAQFTLLCGLSSTTTVILFLFLSRRPSFRRPSFRP